MTAKTKKAPRIFIAVLASHIDPDGLPGKSGDQPYAAFIGRSFHQVVHDAMKARGEASAMVAVGTLKYKAVRAKYEIIPLKSITPPVKRKTNAKNSHI